jgi:hemerythrin superfamily protein
MASIATMNMRELAMKKGGEVSATASTASSEGVRCGPTSRVIRDPQCWQDEGILVPHEAFRWYFRNFRSVLPRLTTAQAPAFYKLLEDYFFVSLEHHHHAEEELYNPMIVAKGATLPDKITADHVEIIQYIADIRALRSAVEAGDEAALAKLKTTFEEFMKDTEDHLAEEEEIYPQLLKDYVTEEEERACVDKIIQSLGLGGNMVFLPVIIHAMTLWKGQEGADGFVETLPPPIKMLYRNFWKPDFIKNNLGVLRALERGEVPKSTGFFGCF